MPPEENRPIAELVELAQFLSGQEINSVSDISPLSGDFSNNSNLAKTYAALRQKHPGNFTISAEATKAWEMLAGVSSSASVSVSRPAGIVTKQPQPRMVKPGTDVAFEVEAPEGSTFQWRLKGAYIPSATNRTLNLNAVSQKDVGSYSVIVRNTSGTAVSKAAPLSFNRIIPTLCGQWDFDKGNLSASIGYDLAFLGGPSGQTALETRFGTPRALGAPDIEKGDATVMAYPACDPLMGFVLTQDAAPNGRGTKLNPYTLILDILWQNPNNQRFSAILQIDDPANLNDSDLFASWTHNVGGIGINEDYTGASKIRVGQWHRIAFAVDMDASDPVIAKHIDGVKHRDPKSADGLGRDGRFALLPTALLFTDENGETPPAVVNSIQLHNARLSDEQIAALGGPTTEGLSIFVGPGK